MWSPIVLTITCWVRKVSLLNNIACRHHQSTIFVDTHLILMLQMFLATLTLSHTILLLQLTFTEQ